jgi:fructosamine-3-kinase
LSVTILPDTIRQAVEEALGARVRDAAPIGGGMICHAARVGLTDQTDVFVKWGRDETPDLFAAEADGLRRLRDARAIRVPEVLAVGDSFLVLEYVAPRPAGDARPPTGEERFAERFGEGLARLHQTSAALFGLERDNYLGRFAQINTPPRRDWPAFYRDCRLSPQIALARDLGLLPAERERLLEGVLGRLDALLDGLVSRPALLHGDLWSGNFLAADDTPILVDPAVYYGEREMEIAFVELFGGFPPGFLPAYRAAFPLGPGYERRRPLHQLYPLLVHLNHFGERYGPHVENVCRLLLADG